MAEAQGGTQQGETDPNKGTQSGGQQSGSGDTDDEDDDDDGDYDKARALSTIKRQRESEKKAKADAKAAQDKIRELEKKDLDELSRAKQEKDEADKKVSKLEREYRKAVLKAEVFDAAADLGISRPKVAMRLIDVDEVEWDDDGQPTNLAKLLKGVLKDMPELREGGTARQGQGGADGGAGRGSATGTGDGINESLRLMAGR